MAYNYFPTNYQVPAYYPSQTQPTQPTQTQTASEFRWVQGESGAKSYLVAPNQTVTLWDSESQTIYLKSADSMGMPSMKILDYTIRNENPAAVTTTQINYATKDDLDSLRGEIDSLKAKLKEKKGEKK